MLLIGKPDINWKTRMDDDDPPRFWEPLPAGPYKGRTVDRNLFEREGEDYYKLVGWDENVIPKLETLRKLGLESSKTNLEI